MRFTRGLRLPVADNPPLSQDPVLRSRDRLSGLSVLLDAYSGGGHDPIEQCNPSLNLGSRPGELSQLKGMERGHQDSLGCVSGWLVRDLICKSVYRVCCSPVAVDTSISGDSSAWHQAPKATDLIWDSAPSPILPAIRSPDSPWAISNRLLKRLTINRFPVMEKVSSMDVCTSWTRARI